jgi:basic amino acid/polyamine antiporter, APA family
MLNENKPMPNTEPTKPQFSRELGLLDSTMIVVGSMIGSGIFIVSADVSRYLGGAGWVLLVWVVTGIVTLIGALSYGELAGMMPKVGGQFVYLKESYNDLIAFLFGWCTFLVIQTGTIAAVAVGFARYTSVLIPFFSEDNILLDLGILKISAAQLLAVASIVVLSIINLRGVKEAKFVQTFLSIIKAVALFGLIVLGFAVAWNWQTLTGNWATAWNSYTTENIDGELLVNSITGVGLLSAFGLAMVGPLFSSSSWNNITYTAAEIKDPKKDIPRSLLYGTLLCSSMYVLANVAYQMLLPVQGLPNGADVVSRGIMFASNDRVGTAAAEMIFGNVGTIIMAVFIMISTFGCNNGLILSGSRVYYAMAKDNLFFKRAGELNKNGVPGTSIIMQSIWASLLCLSGTYGKLLDYTVFTILIFYFLTILGVFILRKKQPAAERPYKAFGYPIIPFLYLIFAFAMCVNLLINKTSTSLAGLVIVALGVVVYFFWKGRAAK